MNRRIFLKKSAVLGAVSLSGMGTKILAESSPSKLEFPNYRGFNLLAKFTGEGRRMKFNEEDFEIMAEHGFNFARIPMSYWNWSTLDNWYEINEEVLMDIDEVVEFGKQYKIHINLNFHRLPGYCINNRSKEPLDLFDDTPENMQKALDAASFHWKTFATRYKGIPSTELSFDLINEPPHMQDEIRYVEIVKGLVTAIRNEDPQRLIIADGKNVGRSPVFGIADLNLVQSTRGYDPLTISHYKAHWMKEEYFETLSVPTWPLKADDGNIWDKDALREKLIDPWKSIEKLGVPVHVGEWGAYNYTPHDVALLWMRDLLSLWKEAGWGHSMWNLKGSFGILNSNRKDIKYEKYRGHKLDREMLELLKEYA